MDRLAPRPLAAALLLVFAALALLPDGTVFNIGGTSFEAASGRSVVRGSYRWRRPRGFDLLDGRFVTLSARVRNARLSVRDAEATEGDDASLDFVVKLSPAASDTVTVAYTTSDGTATAGSDYEATSGELTFAPGETTMTMSVPIIDDNVEDDGETVNLELSGASGADIGDGTAVGTIRNTEGAPTSASGALTAAFSDVPAEHDGESRFTFTLAFSEDVGDLSFRTLRDSAFEVTGGDVKRALRHVEGSNERWTIEVEPDSRADVVITLPETTDCEAEGAVCAPDGRMLSQAVSETVSGPPAETLTPLTAVFQDVPAEHDGEGRFRFTLAFSEDVGDLSFRTLRDSAFEVTSGDVKRALRHVEGSNERWTIEVEPDSRADVVITLPETTDCEAEGAVCAPDGRMLSQAVSETVSGPPAETLAPLTAVFQDVPAEHDGSTSFTVRLAFSEELASGSGRKVGSALTLTGARRGYVERVGNGRDLYSFPVRPSGNGAVTLTLSASASDCAASSAVCTPDGRMLSAAVSAAVQGPPGLPVEDTEVDEGNPNILLYMADDMTWRDANTFGNAAVHTPTLDRLAEEGTTFTHVFTATAMCSPTRHMLYNGQYPVRSGAYPNHAKARLGTKSMVHYLRALGYRVGLAGKSHVAPDSVYRFERLSWGHPDLDAIRRFITRSTSQPFALIVASPQPHRPWRHGDASRYDPASLELPPNFVDTPETRDALSRYYAEITYLDDEFGSVLRILENNGVADDTLTMFYNEQGMAAPLVKATLYEAGVRGSLIARWGDRIPAGRTTDALVQINDLLPTWIEAAGGEPAPAIEGRSFLHLLLEPGPGHRDVVYGIHTNTGQVANLDPYPIRSIRDRRYKLIWNLAHENRVTNQFTERDHVGFYFSWRARAETDAYARTLVERYERRPEFEFYDLQEDPHETINLADAEEHGQHVADLLERLRAWMEDQGDKGLETELEAYEYQVDRGEGARSSLVPAQVPCAYTVTPSHRDVLWPAGTGEVRVTTSSTCAWTAASESVFLAVTSGAAGTGSGTVTWAVAGNAGGPRTGSLVVAGERVTVFQASPTEFTDHPIDRGVTPVRAIHFLELRARVDALRMGAGLPGSGWTDPVLVPGVTPIKRVHLAELRTALLEVYVAAGRPAPIYSTRALTPGTTVIAAVDMMEVRAAVSALDD